MNFEELYDLYSKDIYRFSYWLTGNSFDAKDITSETFIRAWTKFDRIKTETLKGYLLTVAHHIFIDTIRKKKRYTEIEDHYPDPLPSPETSAENQNQLLKVEIFLRSFSEVDKAAFILRVQQELSYEEIARVLNISLSAVKVKIHRIRKKLLEKRIKGEL